MRVAALYTCFNRKEKTLSSLSHLYQAKNQSPQKIELSVYLTDDNSSDGTAEAIASEFPEVNILKGNGELYWAGGMRNSWNKALAGDYDAYLLLNDDTNVKSNLFQTVFETEEYCLSHHDRPGIYIGNTAEPKSDEVSYGGWVYTNHFLALMERVPIDKVTPKSCELGNANIMWVSKNVVDQIGILSKNYVHGMADFDYTYKAFKKNIPVLVMPGIMGVCENDHTNPYLKFVNLPFAERLKMLYHPVGLDYSSQLYYMKKHFPVRFPLFYLTMWFKVLFPNYYFSQYQKRLNLR